MVAMSSGHVFTLAHLSDPHLTSLRGVQPARPRQQTDPRVSVVVAPASPRASGRNAGSRRRGHARQRARSHRRYRRSDAHRTAGRMHRGARVAEDAREPRRVSLVPGNHDRYVAAPFDATVGLWRDYFAATTAADRIPVRPTPQRRRVDRRRHRGSDCAVSRVGRGRRCAARTAWRACWTRPPTRGLLSRRVCCITRRWPTATRRRKRLHRCERRYRCVDRSRR